MNKAGAILGVIAGIFGFLAAIFTLLFGGLASAFGTAGAGTVVGLGWGGIAFSFLVIIFGAVAFAKPKGAGIGLIICSIGGAILGGTLVAICMVLSLVGGVLCVMGAKNTPNTPTQIDAIDSHLIAGAKQHIETQPWSTGRMVLYGIFSFLLPLIGVIAGIVGLLKEPTRKQGAILLMLALAGVVMYSAISSSSKSGTSSSSVPSAVADKYAELAATPAAPLSPTGELADMFNLLSDNTDLQRENKLKEIKGKVVEWTLSVYEVEKDGDEYKVQTDSDDAVGTFVYISPRNDQDKAVIEALKTGSRVSIKGIIGDDSVRHLVIKPAILFQPGSAKPAAAQAPQPAPAMPVAEQAPAEQAAQQNTGVCAEIYKQEEVNPGDNDVVCSNHEFEIADKELNGAYKTVMAALTSDRKSALKGEQIAWVKVKEKQCDEAAAGAINYRQETLSRNQCLIEMTTQRIAHLKNFQ